jgi:hypothetical protein
MPGTLNVSLWLNLRPNGVGVFQEVLSAKKGISTPSLHRLANVSEGMTAMRENHHMFNDYAQNPNRGGQDYEETMWEDVDFLVSELNSKIGSTWRAVRQSNTFNRFSGRGMTRGSTAVDTMRKVYDQMDGWLEYLKSTNVIFEEPEIDSIIDDHGAVVDLTDDLDPDSDHDGDDGDAGPGNSASKWCKSHPLRNGETTNEQKTQADALMARGMARQQVLWGRRAAREAQEAEDAEAEAAREAVRADARAQKVYVVEAIVNRKTENGVLQYRVKWEGYAASKNTWELQDNLVGARKLIAKYEKRHPNKK